MLLQLQYFKMNSCLCSSCTYSYLCNCDTYSRQLHHSFIFWCSSGADAYSCNSGPHSDLCNSRTKQYRRGCIFMCNSGTRSYSSKYTTPPRSHIWATPAHVPTFVQLWCICLFVGVTPARLHILATPTCIHIDAILAHVHSCAAPANIHILVQLRHVLMFVQLHHVVAFVQFRHMLKCFCNSGTDT